jgi:hypothetical protein
MIDLQHLNLKLFAAGRPAPDLEPAIPIFHRWIQEQVFAPQLLIDVADYRHVFQGPGVVLIGFEGDYSLDETGGRLGLRYNQKAALAGSNRDRLRHVFASALRAARRLEDEAALQGRLKFDEKNWELSVNDRALAPNVPESYFAAQGDLEEFFGEILTGNKVTFTSQPDPRARFSLSVQAEKPVNWNEVLKKLS